MARKADGKARKGKARSANIPDRIVSAALELAASRAWVTISLADIAARADLTLAEVHGAFSSKVAIVGGFLGRVDHEVLALGATDPEDGPGDRLFDIIMRRFDAITPHKAAVASIVRGTLFDPLGALCVAPDFLNSMAWMLEAADISSAGVIGLLRVKGLALIYLDTLRVWLADDTEDLAKTMAALDRNLRRAGTLSRLCAGIGRRGDGGEAPAAA
jgi:AcrR family transcriptional regulator